MLISKAYQRVLSMMKSPLAQKVRIGFVSALMTLGIAHNAYAAPAQKPLFQTNSVKPIMMLNMSKDHQMFFKVYDDYSDITDPNGDDPDGTPDTTYIPKYEYYGYFDSSLCYEYVSDNYFNPVAKADAEHYCTASSNQWSGNFLNWASMTRIDAIRKILYGGYRSTDTTAATILERAFIPHDAHAFAKYYNGPKINQLTPFTSTTQNATDLKTNGITICNVTPIDSSNNASQNNTKPPLLRVAKGNYSLWASNESRQCQWDAAGNANDPAASSIQAYDKAPASNSADKLSPPGATKPKYDYGEYVARVKVCVAGYENKDECKQYPAAGSVQKPIGLFQEFGETGKILFGLMTGSYGKNKSGGVLRKTIGNMTNEINSSTGEFFTNSINSTTKAAAAGAISVLNSLRIYGYDYAGNNYGGSGYDDCPFGLAGFKNGSCTNWGNPQAEIYLESLRYLAGKNVNSNFEVDDTGKIPGFTKASWGSAPINSDNYCAPLNVLQFNTSSSTFDDNEMTKETDLGLPSGGVNTWTDKVGDTDHEAFSGSYFVGTKVGGADAGDQNGICTGKTFSLLSAFTGSCPDAPRLDGSYGIAGLAYYARTNDINSSVNKDQTVRTFGVSLAPAVPAIKIPVPGTSGSATRYIEVLPACKNDRGASARTSDFSGREGNCAIVDFKIVNTDIASTNTTNTAKLYVNWEVAEQGNDYDQDMWGTIDISVTSSIASVQTRILKMSAGPSIGFGYVISGTKSDGFKVSSGANNFILAGTYCSAAGLCNCPNAACTQVAPWQNYDVANSSTVTATFLPSALELAAKWGGFSSGFEKEVKNAATLAKKTYTPEFLAKKIKTRDYGDSYYFAANPRQLAKSLRDAFNEIAAGIGAASSVATVSARVSEGSLVYQALFNSEDWSGKLLAYEFTKEGNIKAVPKYCTSDFIVGSEKCNGQMVKNATSRNIYTRGATGLVSLDWDNLTTVQKQGLTLLSEGADVTNAKKRLDWLSGNATYEEVSGGTLRNRGVDANRNILGDIVNSSPVYVGDRNFRYENLPGDAGPAYKAFLTAKKTQSKYIIVGANDGMVHAFNASTLAESFAFIPSQVFERENLTDENTKLTNLSSPTYGVTTSNGHVYSVDGPITYSDVYITVGSVKKWRRVVVGTLGAGARGIYALDVTDATPTILFELNKSDYPELGYVIGKPIIAPMKNGQWTVIFGNGSDSTKASHLFVIDLEHPKDSDFSQAINIGEGTGLTAIALLLNSVGEAQRAYGGDLNGNLWRFDLSSADPDEWDKEYKVFKATTTANSAVSQPITGALTLGVNAQKGFKTMVYFGTGKYFDVGDGSAAIPVQSFYAILDKGSEVSRSSLLGKTVTTIGTTSRSISVANPDWGTQNGWYLDFDANGERVTTKPVLLFDKLIFPTLIPTTAQCDAGGGSWLMEVNAVGDKYMSERILSENLYANSLVMGNMTAVSLSGAGAIALVTNRSNSLMDSTVEQTPDVIEGRQSWRQLQ